MSTSILKDYNQYLSKSSFSSKNDISSELNTTNCANDSQEKTNLINVISNDTIKINFSYNEPSKYKIICKNCNNFPQMFFNDNYTLNLLCNCKSKNYVDFDFFINNYIIKDDINLESQISSKIFVENYCFCDTHTKYFSYICDSCTRDFNKICGMNLCEDCIKSDNKHINHITFFRNDKNIYSNINKIIEFIKTQKNKINNSYSNIENESSNFDDNYKKFLCIIQLILICYKYYFCYNIYKTIISLYEFINSSNTIENKITYNNKIDIKQKDLINVKEKREFIYIYNAEYHEKIKSIEIIKCNFYDITIFEKAKLINLEVLTLSNNNINNFKQLLLMDSPKLKELNLSSNKIKDDNINLIEKMNFPELIFFSLGRNYIHKYEIFNCFKKFKKLRVLYLGSNKFEDVINATNNNINYDLSTIRKLGLSQGVFSNNTIKIISKFQFQMLEEIYIYGNNLNSLSFLENIHIPNLKIFWGHTNNIKDLSPLENYKNLIDINMRNNPIHKTISEIINFVKKFKNLKNIILINTKIEGDKEEIKNTFKEIKIDI